MKSFVLLLLIILSLPAWSMCLSQFQSECQSLEIVSVSKETHQVWESGEKYTNIEYCKVAFKSDKTSKLMYAKLASCPEKRQFIGSIDYACNDISNQFEYDRIRVRSHEDCPTMKRWWEFWK